MAIKKREGLLREKKQQLEAERKINRYIQKKRLENFSKVIGNEKNNYILDESEKKPEDLDLELLDDVDSSELDEDDNLLLWFMLEDET